MYFEYCVTFGSGCSDHGTTVSNGPESQLFFYYAPNGSLSDDAYKAVTGEGGILMGRHEDIAQSLMEIPQAFDISSYPNPFNPSTTISYELPEPAHVKLNIYDVVGREVAALLDVESRLVIIPSNGMQAICQQVFTYTDSRLMA